MNAVRGQRISLSVHGLRLFLKERRLAAMQRSSELSPGRIVGGKYLILREIGSGGTGKVYEVRDLHLKKIWAMKYIRCLGLGRQAAFLELSRMKSINHLRLPRIVDAFEVEDGNCIVMDFLEGETLDCILSDRNLRENLKKEDLIHWGIELCEALNYLHHCVPPIIYRDMKPGNILLRPDRTVMLLDFGTPGNAGTPGYVAPEQLNGNGRVDGRSDIYALGRTLYRLYESAQGNGQTNPGGKGKNEDFLQNERKKQKRKIRDKAFLKVLAKACEDCPEKRFQSADEMARALKTAGESENESNQKRWSKRSVLVSCSVAISLMCIIGGFPAVGEKTTSAANYKEIKTEGQKKKEIKDSGTGNSKTSELETPVRSAERYRSFAETCVKENPQQAMYYLKEAERCLDQAEEDRKESEEEKEGKEKAEEMEAKKGEKEKVEKTEDLYEENLQIFRIFLSFPEESVSMTDQEKETENCFEKLCALDPERHESYLLYISYFYRKGNLKRAADLFRKVSEQNEIEGDPNYQRLKIKLKNAGAV
jgi:serine/threonine protein kinase